MKKFGILILAFIAIGISVWAAGRAPLGASLTNIPFNNMGVIEIDHPENYSRVVAISDVHGMYDNLVTLLTSVHLIDENHHWTGGSALLIVVGDSIDKGPDSVDVLDLWMSLVPQARALGGDVVHSLGNHEAEFLADPTNSKASVFVNELSQKNIPLDAVLNPTYPRAAYLRSMPVAVRVGNWLFAHAGLYLQVEWPTFVSQARYVLQAGDYSNVFLSDDNSILESHGWWKDPDTVNNLGAALSSNHFYGVVFGQEHVGIVTGLKDVAWKVTLQPRTICISLKSIREWRPKRVPIRVIF